MTAISLRPILQGGIIAAGEGRRLRADGCVVTKPMVRVGGQPLIGHAVERLRAAGVRRLAVIINETSEDCRQWLEAHARDIELDLILKTTVSSYASFQHVAARLAGAPGVITTVDGVMPTEDFRDFLRAAVEFPAHALILGVTGYVDDEAPLWAELDPADGRIRRLGGGGGSHVTAGLYVLPAALPADPASGFSRLRDYLGWLVANGHPVYGVVLPRVFDIDRKQDIEAAERAASSAPMGGSA